MQSRRKVLRTFAFVSLFVNSYLPNPSPQPHKQQWTSASRFFSLVSTLYRWRERELLEDFEKDALFY